MRKVRRIVAFFMALALLAGVAPAGLFALSHGAEWAGKANSVSYSFPKLTSQQYINLFTALDSNPGSTVKTAGTGNCHSAGEGTETVSAPLDKNKRIKFKDTQKDGTVFCVVLPTAVGKYELKINSMTTGAEKIDVWMMPESTFVSTGMTSENFVDTANIDMSKK